MKIRFNEKLSLKNANIERIIKCIEQLIHTIIYTQKPAMVIVLLNQVEIVHNTLKNS